MFEKSFLRRFPPGLIAAGILVLAACTTAASPTPATAPTSTAEATPPAGESPTGAAVTYTVNLATGATVGAYLTGGDGRTLYVKADDSISTTTCTGDCLGTWPPLLLEAGEQVEAGAGVTGTISTFIRPEGTTQVTYNDKPLYYFSGDSAAGDTNGQGVVDWSVAAP